MLTYLVFKLMVEVHTGNQAFAIEVDRAPLRAQRGFDALDVDGWMRQNLRVGVGA